MSGWRTRAGAALAAAWLGGAGGAGADTELVAETRRLDGEQRTRTDQVLLDGRSLRVDSRGGRRSVVYRGDRGLVWVIDHERQSYIELERPGAEALADQARARLEALSPEERARAEAALDDPRPDVAVRETGASDRIQDIPCREVVVERAGRRVAEVCRASFADTGVAPGDLAALREVKALLEGSLALLLARDARSEGIASLTSLDPLDGVPLRVRAYRDGAPRSETRVTRLRQREAPEGSFELPDGYQPRIQIHIRGDAADRAPED